MGPDQGPGGESRTIGRRRFLLGAAGLAGVTIAGGALDNGHHHSTLASMAEPDPSSPWIQRWGSSLYLHGRPFRFAGANMYWLGLDNNIRTAAGMPTYPTRARVDQAFAAAQAMGLTMVRAHTLGISVGYPYSIMPMRGQINEAAFAPLDYAIATAPRYGLHLMVPLCDQWRYYTGGKWVFVHWRADLVGEDTNANLGFSASSTRERNVEAHFYTNPTIISDFQNYVAHIMGRVNPLTGVAYKDDPTIAIWETGNELWDSPTAWQQLMGRYVKSLAPHALTADGSMSHRLLVANAPGLHAPDIDIVGSHYFPPSSTTMLLDAAAARSAGKVFVIGEYDWTGRAGGTPLEQWLSDLAGSAASGDLFWALMPYQEDGRPELSGDGYGLNDPPTSPAMRSAITMVTAHARAMSA